MSSTPSDRLHFLDLPYEIRLQVYENALQHESEVLACSCAATIKTKPFLGDCTTACDLRNYVLDMPYPLAGNRQMFSESRPLSVSNKHYKPCLVVGGTKCFATLMRNLPQQHPEEIMVVMRLTVRSSWSHKTTEPSCTLASFDSLVTSLGIGTGKAYTVSTTEVTVLPGYIGEGLELLQAKVQLSMRCASAASVAVAGKGVLEKCD